MYMYLYSLTTGFESAHELFHDTLLSHLVMEPVGYWWDQCHHHLSLVKRLRTHHFNDGLHSHHFTIHTPFSIDGAEHVSLAGNRQCYYIQVDAGSPCVVVYARMCVLLHPTDHCRCLVCVLLAGRGISHHHYCSPGIISHTEPTPTCNFHV